MRPSVCRPCVRARRGPDEKSVYVDANTRIQIVETMMLLPHAYREQKAAFVVSLSFPPPSLLPHLTPHSSVSSSSSKISHGMC